MAANLGSTVINPVAVELARRMRESRDAIAAEWLERILERVALTPNRVFPSDKLLDHVPLLALGIADYLEDPAAPVAAAMPVIEKAMELGALRYAQGFDEGEVLKEFEILGSILLGFLSNEADDITERCSRSELLTAAQRVHEAVALIHHAAIGQFLRLLRQQLSEREDRLRAFNRALTHEFRNKVGAAEGAAQLIDLPTLAEEERGRLKGVVARNLSGMRRVIENLAELSRLDESAQPQRYVRLGVGAHEAVKLLQDSAQERGVEVRVPAELPDVEVGAAVELVLANLLGNAIKYSDDAKPTRWVEIRARVDEGDGSGQPEVIIEVRDNGVGVPVADRGRIFERFFRAATTAAEVEGSGIGLTIVQDVIASTGGRVWAEFPDPEGSVFAIALPYRRVEGNEPVDGSEIPVDSITA